MMIPTADVIREFQKPTLEKFIGRLQAVFKHNPPDLETVSVECPIFNEPPELLSEISSLVQEKYGYTVTINNQPKEDDPPIVKGYLVLTWNN